MDIAMHEFPLMLFTTLAPIGAGAFVALFIAFLSDAFAEGQLKKIDRLTVIPVLVAIVGLGCSFAHLANPGNALNVAATLGRTPLANEVLWFCIFLGLAVVYWIVAMAGGLKSAGIRKAFSGVVAAAGLVAVVFMGLAYLIPAIPVWDSPWSVVQLLGAWLMGGVTLGMLICAMGGAKDAEAHGDELVCKVAVVIGALVFILATVMVFSAGFATTSALIDVTANGDSLMGVYVASLILAALAAVCCFVGKKGRRVALFSCATLLALVAIFLGRMVFYGMQIGLGL